MDLANKRGGEELVVSFRLESRIETSGVAKGRRERYSMGGMAGGEGRGAEGGFAGAGERGGVIRGKVLMGDRGRGWQSGREWGTTGMSRGYGAWR
ncbi:hypothetical protein Tco_0444448 [Tanacetum coccineum]